LPQLLIVLLVLGVLFWGSKYFAKANPATMARLVQQGGGVASLAAAGLLFFRGRIEVALGLVGLGFYLLGFSPTAHWSGAFSQMGKAKKARKTSRVRSAMVEMELDHDSGAMAGVVLAGPFEGKKLAEMTRQQCDELYRASVSDDPDGARLLQAYLDRRFPGWGGADQAGGDAGAGAGGSGKMSEDEAYEVLGLAKGASREEVTGAHRSLMKKLHPDHGGTTSLAARINEAKDVLMRRHG
jgi:hypothetical protein